MQSQQASLHASISELKNLLFRFDAESNKRKIFLVSELIKRRNISARSFQQIHSLLMCLMAYPSDQNMLNQMEDAARFFLTHLKKNQSLQSQLSGSGLLHTRITCNYSYENVLFLVTHFPGQVCIGDTDSRIETQKNILKLLLPEIEYSLIHEGGISFRQRVRSLRTNEQGTDLEWFLNLIHAHTHHEESSTFIYNQAGIHIDLKMKSENDSITFLRGENSSVYFHPHALQSIQNTDTFIRSKLPSPQKLNEKEKEQLIRAARLMLLHMYRETEPFTQAHTDDVTLFQLEHGISIALYGCKPEKRYSLESYIGYMVMKNNIPVSYGGGWLFGKRCQFGINILEPFRGGESQRIICELLRVYHSYLGAERFVVKPYQFGLHNAEAIRTGAFWFYYKLGFKPEDDALRALSMEEDKKRKEERSYRSSADTLRRFTKSNIALDLNKQHSILPDSEVISKRVTQFIKENFDGNRKTAMDECFRKMNTCLNRKSSVWKKTDFKNARQYAILFCSVKNAESWMRKNRKEIISYIELKSAPNERPWIQHVHNWKSFFDTVVE